MNTHAPIDNPPARLDAAAPIHDLLAGRRSPRAFAPRPVNSAQMTSLFEAARWAPSSANEQPWYFIVATPGDAPVYTALYESLAEGNRRWAAAAPLLVLCLARTTYVRTGKPNRHAWYDLGQAVASLALQATAMGLAVHQMGGFDGGEAARGCGVPEGFDPVVILAIGYAGAAGTLPEDLAQRERAPRSRKPLGSFVFSGAWGLPAHHLYSRDEDPGIRTNN